jgi:hypothetical protein
MAKLTVEEMGGTSQRGCASPLGSGLLLVPADDRRISEHGVPEIQWVENVGWHLEHAGWVWAEKGSVGFGGFGLLNNCVLGNFLFRRPADKAAEVHAG